MYMGHSLRVRRFVILVILRFTILFSLKSVVLLTITKYIQTVLQSVLPRIASLEIGYSRAIWHKNPVRYNKVPLCPCS
ncbi:hypothetical protein K470DRAFT_179418 [Piedraia hortae CBS 480.64]|uniref:Uncharacterized protein n=1 Tax=Piedraia hortae CBS 480.64 TaxID=1314780 RepID=A0A6A7BQ18_9PEZI|nr:hypothetical protein K470DRAFT_179418 [Piedraia hortae CBS 480.64]